MWVDSVGNKRALSLKQVPGNVCGILKLDFGRIGSFGVDH